jgi:two-component system CheB/CheR fusion protein
MTDATSDPNFEELLHYLKRSRGFDFTGYKRPSLMRLTKKRMGRVGMSSFSDYLDYLEVHPLELSHLFDTLLLNVTAFFRDKLVWDYLSAEIIPRLLSTKDGDENIRVWSAGCASGEEAYTIAILLAEALGIDAFRSRVKIYATDIDEKALTQGRAASYTATDLQNVPEALRRKYFEENISQYNFRTDLRNCVIFGRHDLVQHAPISRLDLLVCRNTLMYFNAETQARILARFHFALKDNGFLLVGKAEMLVSHFHLFNPANLKYRFFSKVPQASLRDHSLVMAAVGNEASISLVETRHWREEAFETLPLAQIVVDIDGNLVMANQQARSLFGIAHNDIGRHLQDLEISDRPAELRSPIQQAYTERRSLLISDVEFSQSPEDTRLLNIQVIPLLDNDCQSVGVSIIFSDETRYNQLQRELQHFNQGTGNRLQELQSTNEELETTNEELQTTNEELEAMNEELQSSNEELQHTNEELRDRTNELDRINGFSESILTSLRVGLVVLDARFSIQVWNKKAEDLWGLRADEVQGHLFFDLDIGLPLNDLLTRIRAWQTQTDDEQAIVLDAINRRGRSIRCRVLCTPLIIGNQHEGVILLMEELTNE